MPSKEELPLTGYMGAIAFLLILLAPPLRPLTRYRSLLWLLTAASLLLTWSQMFLFLHKSYVDSASRAKVPLSEWTPQRWLGSTQLFHEAWWYVCAKTERWWWSSQICTGAVGVWTPFLWREGRRHKIKYLAAYMLLGQIVAISFASGLFLLALPALAAATPTSSPDPSAPVSLLFAVLIGSLSTFAIPYVLDGSNFLPILLLMHLFLFFPLLPFSVVPFPVKFPRVKLSNIYILSSLLSSIHYLLITLQLPTPPSNTTLPRHLFDVLAHHPAQASVSTDVLSFVALTFVWLASDWRSQLSARNRATAKTRKRGEGEGMAFAAVLLVVWGLTPIVGPAGTFAAYLAWRERTAAATERLKAQSEASR